jgi:hypothetical protein
MSERDEARRLLRELLGDVASNGHPPATPQVPAPPVAAVHRPSTWSRPPAPGEAIGDGPVTPAAPAGDRPAAAAGERPAPPAPSPPAGDGRVEVVSIASDADLDAFVRSLLARFENPRDRMAIRAGKLRFALRHATAAGEQSDALRVERGAVTERTVKQAADAGAHLVLAPRAVLTPLAREKAKALGVRIERERRC